VVTRGVGDLGLDPGKCTRPTLIVIAGSIALYPRHVYEDGLSVITVATRRTSATSLDPAIKSLNYLNNILARVEVNRAKVEEGIMLNAQGLVAEATGDNVFIVRGGRLLTPPEHAGILIGVTRNAVMELAEGLGIPVEERDLTPYSLYCADECFLTGTAAELVPVARIDDRLVGDGRPGAITGRLREAFHSLTQVDGVPIGLDGDGCCHACAEAAAGATT
jgi:branched-chain amino acid aminotransferase